MPHLQIDNITKKYGSFYAVRDFTLDIPSGHMMCLLGPSGCGKTTVLRMVAGLETIDGGQILLDGENISHLPAHKRDIGMVFQSHALFPHLTVGENISFGLNLLGVPKSDQINRVEELLEMIRLPGSADKRINQLSGGQRQRVAIARALAREPTIFLLDEPTSALDANLRETLQIELKRLQKELKITTIVVTHDQAEAMTLADMIVVMDRGRVAQAGGTMDIYEKPNSVFVADFIGTTNLIDGEYRDDGIYFGNQSLEASSSRHVTSRDTHPVKVSIRTERVVIYPSQSVDASEKNYFSGKVSFVRNVGNVIEVRIDCDGFEIIHSHTPAGNLSEDKYEEGDEVVAFLPSQHCRAYSHE